MKVVRWLLPLLSLAIVLLVTLWDLGGARMGPGPVHPAHARLAELDGGSRCEACHRPGHGVDAGGCAKCHAPIQAQLDAGRGLHGSLAAGQRERCETCHSDHHGASAPLIAAHAFALAGVAAPQAYDHRHVAYGLAGVHATLACARCHVHADDPDPPVGGRFLGLSQECSACHEDAHRGAFGADCATCHHQEGPWTATPGFRHEAFALRDAHREVECAVCHPAGTIRAVAALQAEPRDARRCGDCHDDPHGAGAAGVRALRLPDTADCARCHAATKWSAARVSAEQHAGFGWPLRGGHAAVDCAACHGDAGKASRWTASAPPLADCAACHQHPHRAEVLAAVAGAPAPAGGCAACHDDADRDFRAGRVDAARHAAIGFALAAPHADVACAKCHAGDSWQGRFPGRGASECRSCHADVHRGQFDHEVRYRQCTACHLETSFRPPQFGIEAHGRTAFPLTGAHDAVGCVACHRDEQDGVRTFHGTASECGGCHADVHAGTFDRAGRPKAIDGRQGCARCHDTQAFAPVTGAFDHALWTGYDLTGAHARVDCAKCHPRAARGGEGGSRLGRAAGTNCASCHRDPHAGQFAQGGATDCRRCHTTSAFAEVRFDHGTTRFPLDEVHRPVACAECHLAYDTPQGRLVRYKPLGTACGDCHKLGRAGGVLK